MKNPEDKRVEPKIKTKTKLLNLETNELNGNFVELLGEKIRKDNTNQVRDNTKFHISDMGRCYRMRFLKRLGMVGEPYNDRVLRVFAVGTILHEWLQEQAEQMGVLVGKEIRVENANWIGHADAIIQTDGYKVLYDFKTVNSRKFTYLARGESDEHYILQLLTYLVFLQGGEHKDLQDARLLYISKDDLRLHQPRYHLTDERKDAIMLDMATMEKHWEEQTLPLRCEGWESKYCTYCPKTDSEVVVFMKINQRKDA